MTAIEDGARAVAPRPVVLVHGDTHAFTIDTPVKSAPTLTRVSTFGAPLVHWIRVAVDPHDPAVFAFSPQVVQKSTGIARRTLSEPARQY